MHVVQVIAHHHFKDLEELTVGDVPVVVDIVDLESESKLLLVGRSGGEGVKALDELEEGNGSILIFVKNSDDSFNEWIICKLYKGYEEGN